MKKFLILFSLFCFTSELLAEGDPVVLMDGLDADWSDPDDSSSSLDDGSSVAPSHYYPPEQSTDQTVGKQESIIVEHKDTNSTGPLVEQPLVNVDLGAKVIEESGNTLPLDQTINSSVLQTSEQQHTESQIEDLIEHMQDDPRSFETKMLAAELSLHTPADQLEQAFESYFNKNLENKTPQERSEFMAEITDSINMANNMSTAILDALQAAQATAKKRYVVKPKSIKDRKTRSAKTSNNRSVLRRKSAIKRGK